MNRLMILAGCFVVMLASLGFTAQAQAGYNFGTGAGLSVNPDFNSGNTWGSGSSQNAVTTSLQVNIDLHFHPSENVFVCHVNTTASGVWGDPNDDNPWYDVLKGDGLNTYNSVAWKTVEFNGEYYEFIDQVSINTYMHANLFMTEQDGIPEMYGSFSSNAYSVGMVPTDVLTTVEIFEAGHPEWLPDWQVAMSSTWVITADFQVVPAPGALALLGLGGLISRRRRS